MTMIHPVFSFLLTVFGFILAVSSSYRLGYLKGRAYGYQEGFMDYFKMEGRK